MPCACKGRACYKLDLATPLTTPTLTGFKLNGSEVSLFAFAPPSDWATAALFRPPMLQCYNLHWNCFLQWIIRDRPVDGDADADDDKSSLGLQYRGKKQLFLERCENTGNCIAIYDFEKGRCLREREEEKCIRAPHFRRGRERDVMHKSIESVETTVRIFMRCWRGSRIKI